LWWCPLSPADPRHGKVSPIGDSVMAPLWPALAHTVAGLFSPAPRRCCQR
jgi:hypothetical protein